jgi:hypothetical protein
MISKGTGIGKRKRNKKKIKPTRLARAQADRSFLFAKVA